MPFTPQETPSEPHLPDPKLKEAMEEIKAVLKKHDIAGVAILSSPTHMEYLNSPEASWSCITIEPQGDGGAFIRIRSQRSEYPTKEAQVKKLSESTGFLMGTIDCIDNLREQFVKLAVMLSQHVQIEHKSRHIP